MYGKKRGHRRTGSKTLGSVGEALFFAFFFATGAAALFFLLQLLVIPEWRVNHDFVEHTCVVLKERIAENASDDGTTYRPEFLVRYDFDGASYVAWAYDITQAYSSGRAGKQTILDRFEVDHEYPCWYDPNDPRRVVLVRGYTWWLWVLLLLPLAFIGIGGGGIVYTLLHWGKSTEHRAATNQLARLELFEETALGKSYPHVPFDENQTNSPGTRLKYRLPVNLSQGWRLFASAGLCLFWNGIVSIFVVAAIRGHARGEPNWPLTIFILPFVAIGVGIIFYFVRELLVSTGVGPIHVEISDHPLWPGKQYQVLLSLSGRLTIKSLAMSLVCEEQATYRQGTDTRTDRRQVFERQLLVQENFEILPGAPYEGQCALEVPPNSMHSFKADHNEVQWKLVVQGVAAKWPNFNRSFSVVVYPQAKAPA